MSERRVLMTTYFFPPVAGVGVERTLKHVAYLPESGWRAVVIGPRTPGYRLVDALSVARIPVGTDVHRAFAPEPAHLRQAVRTVRRTLGALLSASCRGLADTAAAQPSNRPIGLRSNQALDAANAAWARLIPLVFFPDEQLLWAPAAALVGLRVHRSDPVDALYSSSPPISSHLAAALLASVTGLPWVADFRDPWVGNAFGARMPAPYESLRERMERVIVARASRIVFATPTLRERYAARYPHMAHKFVAVMNGYDRAELAGLRDPAGVSRRPFRLIYTGSVYGERELGLVLDGVEHLLARRPALRDQLRIDFIGWFSAANHGLAVRRFPALAPILEHTPQLPRADALARAASADAGLLLLADGPDRDLFVGAKLFDYIGLDLPVLAIAPEGDARRVLRELDWGICVEPTARGVASGLERLLDTPPPGRAADPDGRFERRSLSRQLSSLLNEVAIAR